MIRRSAAALLLGITMLTLSAAPALAAGPGENAAAPAGAIVSAPALPSGTQCADDSSCTIDTASRTFDVARFAVPEDTKNLVVVEGFAKNGGRDTYKEEHGTYHIKFVADVVGGFVNVNSILELEGEHRYVLP